MNFCDCRALFANEREMAQRRSETASENSGASIRKNRRQVCRRMKLCFPEIFFVIY